MRRSKNFVTTHSPERDRNGENNIYVPMRGTIITIFPRSSSRDVEIDLAARSRGKKCDTLTFSAVYVLRLRDTMCARKEKKRTYNSATRRLIRTRIRSRARDSLIYLKDSFIRTRRRR